MSGTQPNRFDATYDDSRVRFRASAKALDWQLHSHAIDQKGPQGQELTIDVAVSEGSLDRAIVVSSGVHGVEGFFGAAVQNAIMSEMLDGAVPKIRCVFIHAVNPYGFAWLRRFDECNVDPNRNFLTSRESYDGCPDGYHRLDPFLNPKRVPASTEPFLLKCLARITRHGMATLRNAVAAGQYEYPQGIFYGGNEPSAAHRILDHEFQGWLGRPERVVHLDFHTGLGRWGTWKLLIDHPLSEPQCNYLDKWFGTDFYEPPESEDADYRATGGLGEWCASRGFANDYLFACAEFGTYSALRVLSGIRKENCTHHFADPESSSSQRAKARLQELFCPASRQWRSQVLDEGCQIVRTAVRSLS